MKILIVGDGAFGSFLHKFLGQSDDVEFSEDAEVVILAVPFAAYDDVAYHHKGKILVNVCSVQAETTRICLEHSEDVIGLHPLFGARTPKDMEKVCLLTNSTANIWSGQTQRELFKILENLGVTIVTKTPEGEDITGWWHDRVMAGSHKQALAIAELAEPMLRDIKDIPATYLPASVNALRRLVDQLQDMPKGTRDSIKANHYDAY